MKSNNLQFLISSLSSRNDWVSASDLASYLHTTTRTIRNYVNEINASGEIPLIQTSHRGYRWNSDAKSATPFFYDNDVYDTPEKRIRHILKQLLYLNTENRSDPLTIDALCEEMAISVRTLEIDLDAVREALKKHDLLLHIRKDRLSLSGKECSFRRMIFSLISNNLNKNIDSDQLQRVYPAIPIDRAAEKLKESAEQYGLAIDSYHLYPLLLMIIIQIMRVENKHLITAEEIEIPNLTKKKEYQLAEELITIIRNRLEISFGWWEQNYLAMILICMMHRTDFSDYVADKDVSEYADYFLSRLENHDGISYREDGFPMVVKDHLERLIISCRCRISVYNPLRSSLRNNSVILHNYSAWIVSGINRRFNIHVDAYQLAFFELLLLSYQRKRKSRQFHISCTFVCPGYNGLEQILTDKLNDHFHKLISIDETVSDINLNDLPKSDLYISLLPLYGYKHTVQVSPTLTGKDYRNIQNEISAIEQEKRYQHFEMYLRSYSSDDLFEKDHNFSSREEAISYICRQLVKKGYVRDDFEDEVLNRESADPTSYHNLIAIPHASTDSVIRNGIFVLLNDKAVRWEHHKVNMIVLVAMERVLNDDFERFMDLLIRLFESKNNLKTLLESTDYDSFLEKIARISRTAIY